MSALPSELPAYTVLPEPELFFDGKKTHRHPLMGLISHGPYSAKLGVPATVRLALLAPRLHTGKLEHLVAELGRPAKPKEATNYYPDYPGFEKLFRILRIPAKADTDSGDGGHPRSVATQAG